jgi:two-component system response regulator FixJ
MYRPVIYIVDDDPAVRKSLALWLGFRSLATQGFDSAESFLESVDADCQGCGIVDVRLGGMDGLELQARLVAKGIAMPLIFLTGHGDVATARSALKGGAFDFLEKPIDNDRLIALLGEALQRDEQRWQARQQAERLQERIARLTPREREVMGHVIAGRQNREIAAQMSISARTVEVYKARLMDKLDVRRVPDLVRLIMKAGD